MEISWRLIGEFSYFEDKFVIFYFLFSWFMLRLQEYLLRKNWEHALSPHPYLVEAYLDKSLKYHPAYLGVELISFHCLRLLSLRLYFRTIRIVWFDILFVLCMLIKFYDDYYNCILYYCIYILFQFMYF